MKRIALIAATILLCAPLVRRTNTNTTTPAALATVTLA